MNRAVGYIYFAVIIFSIGTFNSTVTSGQNIRPGRAEAEDLNRRAIASFGEKRFSNAIELLEKAIKADPEFADAHFNLGTVLATAERPYEALKHIQKGLELNPDSHIGYNQLGTAYDKLEKTDLAISAFQKALEIKPDYALAQFNLGAAYVWAGRLKPGEASLEKAARLDPSNAEIKLYLGAIYSRQGRHSEAIATVKKLTRESPKNERANLMLCRLYLLADDRQSALDMYQSFKTVNTALADQMFKSIFSGQVLSLPGKQP